MQIRALILSLATPLLLVALADRHPWLVHELVGGVRAALAWVA